MKYLLWFALVGASAWTSQLAATTADPAALDALREAAERSHSDAVLILQGGEVVADWTFGEPRRPIETMSVLKSLVAVGIGRLLHLGHLESLDQPVHTLYPEWKQGRKQEITVRHLLNHTSGLQDHPSAGVEIYPSPDAVKLALAAELVTDPGSEFRYSNKATNLLSGIVETASGKRMDQFFDAELFGPMGIEQHQWYYDASGTPHGMAGLELLAADLAKFGQLLLDDGVWEGERLIAADFVEEMVAASQPHYPSYGLLWWLLPSETHWVLDEERMNELAEAGTSAEDLTLIEPLVGRRFASASERDGALESVLGGDWRTVAEERYPGPGFDPIFRRVVGEIVAWYADGYLGQTLMVIPEHRVVAVRQVRGDEDYDRETDGFRDYKALVLAAFGAGER